MGLSRRTIHSVMKFSYRGWDLILSRSWPHTPLNGARVMRRPVNGIYVLQGVVPGDIAAAPVGVKVVDIYESNGVLFTPAQVTQMEAGTTTLLGYFNVGEAE